MTRAERSAHNKRVHAVRRALVTWIADGERAIGMRPDWAEIRATVEAIDAVELLANYADLVESAPAREADSTPARKRRAPKHVEMVAQAYRLARLAWESQLEQAMAGARSEGARCRCSDDCGDWTEEECRFRREHPAPVYRDYLAAYYAERRALEGDVEAAGDAG